MRLPPERLNNHLEKSLAPVYLIAGDEPLQHGEAADAVRAQARQRGFSSREVMEQSPQFNWQDLTLAAASLSLFSEQRIIDLRLPSPKIGAEGARALSAYLERPPEDTLLLISSPKLDRAQLGTKWVKAVDEVGVLVQIWPVEGQRLIPWIDQRLRSRGLVASREAVAMLAERVEGNLLAAAQEIEKLLLLQGPGAVSPADLAASVADSARFDIYGLVDAALQGGIGRVQRMLYGLRDEGVAEPLVLWALAREIRVMARMAWDVSRGQAVEQVMGRYRVWDKRKPLVRQGLKRHDLVAWRSLLRECARVDAVVKGQERWADPWEALLSLSTRMAGLHLAGIGESQHGSPDSLSR